MSNLIDKDYITWWLAEHKKSSYLSTEDEFHNGQVSAFSFMLDFILSMPSEMITKEACDLQSENKKLKEICNKMSDLLWRAVDEINPLGRFACSDGLTANCTSCIWQFKCAEEETDCEFKWTFTDMALNLVKEVEELKQTEKEDLKRKMAVEENWKKVVAKQHELANKHLDEFKEKIEENKKQIASLTPLKAENTPEPKWTVDNPYLRCRMNEPEGNPYLRHICGKKEDGNE